MQPLHLDYQRSYQPFPTLGAVLLVCAFVIGLQTARQYLDFTEILAAWEAREVQIERVASRHDVTIEGNHQDKDHVRREVARANEVLRRITLPWDRLFRAVEAAAPKDVALLAMEPDSDKQALKIAGEAKDIAATLDYIRRLEGDATFRTVLLQSHQIQQQDPQRPIHFTLVATWRDQP
jgi:Tfp pilus assembly protein PilN